ncbi:hypothetical protein ACFPM7_15200 [Actinokineospora guangxiensis]|uniref:ADP-heptose:LPS heptosyltransferase n=1 Tax=Actinokineospora guangxiensis TaxID=1490288 RepID=A0ABW0ELV5_9PSEU
MGDSLLVNFVYCHPVGHAVEALHYAFGYHRADPGRRIGVVLNAATAHELARRCPWVDEVYTVQVDAFTSTRFDLSSIPAGWDFVVDDVRGHLPDQRALFPGLAAYYDAAGAYFAGARGVTGGPRPEYARGQHLRIPVEPAVVAGGPWVAVLPGGSAQRSLYPSVRSWRMVMDGLREHIPGVRLLLVGKLVGDGRTATTYSAAEMAELAGCVDDLAVDVPLVAQLERVAACGALVSPHSGFGMAALAVGTPWLVLGGNKWAEYFFNGVPFHTVLPDVARFPCYTGMGPDPALVQDDGPRAPSMSRERVAADLGEIVERTAALVAGRVDYGQALVEHARARAALDPGNPLMTWSLDDTLARALTA